jgi:putative membrane protein
MTVKDQISQSLARRRPPSTGRGRAPLTRVERRSVQAAAAAIAGFAVYGFATHSPSTVGYVSSVLLIAMAVVALRRAALPGLLAVGLAAAAVLSLAGGLVNVGRDVLYNASVGPYSESLGTHFLQYDHFAHAYTCLVATFACWVMLAAPHAASAHRRDLVILAVGSALGLGGVNEMVEFIATLAHHGAHAGGYWNTGWDLICNFIGAGAAGIVIARSRSAAARPAPAGTAG